MSKETFDKLANKPKLAPCPIAAYSFDGKSPIQSIGTFKTLVKANGHSVTCEFVVFKDVRDNLLGFKSCVQLGLVQLTYALAQSDDFADAVKSMYPALFTGRIGKLKGVELGIRDRHRTQAE